jgi:hypothetical protein
MKDLLVNEVSLEPLEYKDLKCLNGGLVLGPWKKLAKLLALMAIEVAGNWEEYQKAYKEGYEAAKNNGY